MLFVPIMLSVPLQPYTELRHVGVVGISLYIYSLFLSFFMIRSGNSKGENIYAESLCYQTVT
jgi:hypothetical protein